MDRYLFVMPSRCKPSFFSRAPREILYSPISYSKERYPNVPLSVPLPLGVPLLSRYLKKKEEKMKKAKRGNAQLIHVETA